MQSQQVQLDLINRLIEPLEPIPTSMETRWTALTIKAVIFDIYGTLLISAAGDVGPDSAEENEQAFRQAVTDGGWDAVSVKTSGARLLHRAIQRARQEKQDRGVDFPEIDILQIWQEVLRHLDFPSRELRHVEQVALSYECRTNPVWPMPGLVEVLAGLQAMGASLGLLSNAQFYTPLLCEALCEQSLLSLGFDPKLCLFSYQEGEGKPSRNLFCKLSDQLIKDGVSPSEILYVGNDMLKDIWPAATVGWKTALFAGDKRSLRLREDDSRVGDLQPDLVIDDLRQLISVLG